MVERFGRTLNDKMYKYFTAASIKRWVEVTDDLVQGYNTSYHGTINITPEEAVQDPYEVVENITKSESASEQKIN